VTDTTTARRALLTLLLDRVDRSALLPAERPLLRACVAAEQGAADARESVMEHSYVTRAKQADVLTARTKELLTRRTGTLLRRAEKAEAALARVRALAEPATQYDDVPQDRLARDILAALDGPTTPDDGQPDAPDTRLQAVTDALTAEHYRRAREQVVASPEEHSVAMAAVALDAIDGRHWRGTDGIDIANAYMDAQAALARVRELHRQANNGETCVYCAPLQRLGYDTTWPCDTVAALDGPSPTPDDAQATADRAALAFCSPLVNAACPGHQGPPYCNRAPSNPITPAVTPVWVPDDSRPCPTQFPDGNCAGTWMHPGDCTTNADDIPSTQETDAPSEPQP
jgi:hypothetical protein